MMPNDDSNKGISKTEGVKENGTLIIGSEL